MNEKPKDHLAELEKPFQAKETRISSSLERVTDALHCRPVDRVPVLQMGQPFLYPRHEIFLSRGKELADRLKVPVCSVLIGSKVKKHADTLFEHGADTVYLCDNPILKHDTDYVPHLDPFEGVTVLSEVFECRVEVPHNGDPWIREPLIRDDSEQVYRRRTTRSTSGLCERCAASTGKRALLVSSDDGISISDDEAILLSPDLSEEFGFPYLNRISEAFGGLYYHCGGEFGLLLDGILSIRGLRAINGHMSPRELKPEYVRKIISKAIGLFVGGPRHTPRVFSQRFPGGKNRAFHRVLSRIEASLKSQRHG